MGPSPLRMLQIKTDESSISIEDWPTGLVLFCCDKNDGDEVSIALTDEDLARVVDFLTMTLEENR